MTITIHPAIEAALKEDIEVTISKNNDGSFEFDMNLRAKSSMSCYPITEGPNKGKLLVKMRYDEEHIAEDFDDLLSLAKRGMHGNNYIHHAWEYALKKHGYWEAE